MVFIHGGFFIWGSGNPSTYGPEYLCTKNIVLVTINYRLGLLGTKFFQQHHACNKILGFLSFEDSMVVPGNAGLKDQVMALKWIKSNVINFQGDPENITIFGQCAGAASVDLHILSPASEGDCKEIRIISTLTFNKTGLFHKAIMQSGCALNPWVSGVQHTAKLLADFFCRQSNNEAEILDYLSKVDVGRICLAQQEIMNVGSELKMISEYNCLFLKSSRFKWIRNGFVHQ